MIMTFIDGVQVVALTFVRKSPRELPTGGYVGLEPIKNRTSSRVLEAREPGVLSKGPYFIRVIDRFLP